MGGGGRAGQWSSQDMHIYRLNSPSDTDMVCDTAKNSYKGNIEDHRSQITITNTVIMKKSETLRELPKCDTETQSEHMLEK